LIEDRSRIDVGQDARGRYVLEVTEAGSDPVQSDPSKLALDNLVSIGRSIEGPGVELDAYTTYTFWGREFEGRGYVALSDLGAGVSSTRDLGQVIGAALEGELGLEDIQKFGTAGPKETLRLTLEDENQQSGEGQEFMFLDQGGKSVGIEFDILGGEGTVEVTLIDDETGVETTHEFETEVEVEVASGSGRGRAGLTELQIVEQIQADMGGPNTFEQVEISTTGDLEIAVTGISLVSGFVDIGEVI